MSGFELQFTAASLSLLLLGMCLLRLTERPTLAANWIATSALLCAVAFGLRTGDIFTAMLVFTAVVPLFLQYSIGPKHAAVWACVAAGGLFGYGPIWQWFALGELSSASAVRPLLTGIGPIGFVLFTVLVVYHYRRHSDRSRKDRRQLTFQAQHDPLTGLPNRLQFRKQLTEVFDDNKQHLGDIGMGLIDIDRFSSVNESLGTAAADDLLIEVGRRLDKATQSGKTLARLGADKFMILIPDTTKSEIRDLATRIQKTFESAFFIGETQIHVTASLGFAGPFTSDQQSFDASVLSDTLSRTADRALQEAKNSPNTSWEIFDPSAWGDASRILQHETRIREGIIKKEFIPHFQPIFNLNSKQIAGFEVLARWEHPERGIVSPAEFIPAAERMGLMGQLGNVILEQTCRAFARLEQTQMVQRDSWPPKIYINLSPKQIDHRGDLIDLFELIETYAPDELTFCFEITETDLLSHKERVAQIRKAGHEVVIDDFGTGYSSMARLREIEVDGFKLDMEFLHDVPESRTNSAIAQTVIDLGHRLDLPVIGEGVERQEQMPFLEETGCTAAQGFYLGKPGRLDSFLNSPSKPRARPN